MRFVSLASLLFLASAACGRSSSNADTGPPMIDASTGQSIVSINTSPPANLTAVQLRNVVVLEAFGSTCNTTYPMCRYGQLYVQDKGGGRSSGMHIFCDTAARTNPCSTANRDLIKNLHTGQVLDIDGLYDTGPAFTVSEQEVKPTAITDKGTTFAPAAVTVTAAELAIPSTAVGNLRNVYVKITATGMVTNTLAPEFASTTKCKASGDGSTDENNDAGITAGKPYRGYEETIGTDVVAISLLNRAAKFCLPDCPGFACDPPNLVTNGAMFTSTAGLVQLNTFGCPSTGTCNIGCPAGGPCTTSAYIFVEPLYASDMVCPNPANCPQ